MSVVEHIGRRIRLYRKQKKMTIDALSSKLHLSPSTISKYENGKIAMDVETLSYIASELGISINQLVDYEQPVEIRIDDIYADNFFKRTNLFYVYRYYSMERKLSIDVIEINPIEKERFDKVMIYRDCKSEGDYTKCSRLYSGRIYYSNTSANIISYGIHDDSDLVNYVFNSSKDNKSFGILTGVSKLFHKPYSAKVIASIVPLEHNKEIKDLLKSSDKATINNIKETNTFFAE